METRAMAKRKLRQREAYDSAMRGASYLAARRISELWPQPVHDSATQSYGETDPAINAESAARVGMVLKEEADKAGIEPWALFVELDEKPGRVGYQIKGQEWHFWLRRSRNSNMRALQEGMGLPVQPQVT